MLLREILIERDFQRGLSVPQMEMHNGLKPVIILVVVYTYLQ
jgi:hypothetical protein